MLIEIRDWREDLRVGDLTYYKGTLLKVTRRWESKDGKRRTVKFRKIARLRLKPWQGQGNECGCQGVDAKVKNNT